MADTTTVSSPAPRKRRGWLRAIAWVLGVLAVLLVISYFVVTSSAFFKAVVLPKVSSALNAQVTVSDASIHPFKEVVLHNLKVQTTGVEPLVTAAEVRLRYSLMDIIGGNIHVNEFTLTTPTVTLVENPDGTSNLDPLLKAQKEKAAAPVPPVKPSTPSKPAQVDIGKIALTDATIRTVKLYDGNHQDVTELSHVNVTLEGVRNGQSGKLALSAELSMNNNPPAPGANGVMQGKVNGNFTFALTAGLKPASVQGNTRLEVTRAEGALAQLATLAASLDCDVNPAGIKQVALRFQRAGAPLGEMLVSGPLNLETTEGRVTIQLLNIDKNLLNLAGAGSGIDFGPTTLNSTNEIQLAKSGALVTAAGQFNLNKLQMTRAGQTTPPLDLRAGYNVTVDTAGGSALLRAFTLDGAEKGNPLLHAELTSPMTFAWGNATNAAGDSAFNLAVTRLNLADWKPFLGDSASAGNVNLKLQLLSQQGGKQLAFDLSSQIDNLTAGAGSNQISQAAVTLQVNGKAVEMKQFDLTACKLQVARQNQPLAVVSGFGTYDSASQSADMQLDGQFMLARLLQALPRPDVNISSGAAELKARLTQKEKTQNITGTFALTDFTGQVGSNSFRGLGVTANLDAGMTPQQVQIRKLDGALSEGQAGGGTFAFSGTYDLTNKSAQLNARLANFNQDGLRPFLEPMLADKKLVSVALNADAAVQYEPQGASAVKANLQVTNLVVSDPSGQFPAAPLEAKMQADVSLNKQVIVLRQLQLGLAPTARATNQVRLAGQVDLSNTNAIQGNLKLTADSLDLTGYYDLFAGQKKAARKPPAPAATAAAPASGASTPEKEPDAKQLPFRNFTTDANIQRLYLHEVEITNLQTTVKIDGGHVVVNPFKLALNGAPVGGTVDLDLGVPGYKYDLSFSAQAVPLTPLVDSFAPERKGQLGGTFTSQTKLSGAGTTGASLQKALAGQFDISLTNLNLSVANIQSPLLKTLVNVVATIPALARNPTSAVTSLLGSLSSISGAGSSGGLADELTKSPINEIIARGNAASGQIALQQATVQSAAFEADASGTATLAAVWTNSAIQIPVSISLSRSAADKLNLVPANTASNAAYVKLPDFLTMRGTVGQPKADMNKTALAGMVVKSIGGGVQSGGSSAAGSVLQGLGGLLGGRTPAASNAPPNVSTNQPATPQQLLRGLFNR